MRSDRKSCKQNKREHAARSYKPTSDKIKKDVSQLCRTVKQKVINIDDNMDEIDENAELIMENKETIQLHVEQIDNIKQNLKVSSMALNIVLPILNVVSNVIRPITGLTVLEAIGDFVSGDLQGSVEVRIPSTGVYIITGVIQWSHQTDSGYRAIIINAGLHTFQAPFGAVDNTVTTSIIQRVVSLQKDDFVDFAGLHNAGSDLEILGSSFLPEGLGFSISKIH